MAFMPHDATATGSIYTFSLSTSRGSTIEVSTCRACGWPRRLCDCREVRLLESLVDDFGRMVREFAEEAARAVALAIEQDRRIARFAPREFGQHVKGHEAMAARARPSRSHRLPRSALPARFSFYQGAF